MAHHLRRSKITPLPQWSFLHSSLYIRRVKPQKIDILKSRPGKHDFWWFWKILFNIFVFTKIFKNRSKVMFLKLLDVEIEFFRSKPPRMILEKPIFVPRRLILWKFGYFVNFIQFVSLMDFIDLMDFIYLMDFMDFIDLPGGHSRIPTATTARAL